MTKPIRPIRIEGNIAYVPLTRGYEAVIDAADVPLVDGFNWSAVVRKQTVYAVGSICDGQKWRNTRMHRVILGGAGGLEVDHIDGNGINNRRGNLRVATHAQNTRNQRTHSDNASGFKGVSWDKAARKWRADITLNGLRRNLGRFATPEAAHAAYVVASEDLHGEFGRTS
jgi:hypothetical protein